MTEKLIELRNIFYSAESDNLSFNKKETADILFDVSLSINEKEIIGICGESGGGKSTLAKLIAGIIKPTKGELVLNSKIIPAKNKPQEIQILFQNSSDLINPYRKINAIINEALKLAGTKREDIETEKNKLAETININTALLNRRGLGLSGGERQRIALARLLAVGPKVLILDEPFSAQDITSQINFVKLLKKINEEMEVTIICISHDLKILRNLTQKVIILKEGKVVETGTTEEVFNNPKNSYTRFLLSAESLELSYDELHNRN